MLPMLMTQVEEVSVANVEDTGGTCSCTCPQPILPIKLKISYICIIVHGESISSSQLPKQEAPRNSVIGCV